MIVYDYPIPATQYAVYEAGADDPLAYFDQLTGGDEKLTMVTYKLADGKGNVTEKSMPGQVSYEPVLLLRAMDSFSKDMKVRFMDSVAGMLVSVRKNYSISLNDAQGNPVVWWHLFNAIPLSITGFSFNDKAEAYYTDFEITLQVEKIVIQFEPIGQDPI